jgi:Uncharacterized membrane protein, required for spore maturation in B.subtilis.
MMNKIFAVLVISAAVWAMASGSQADVAGAILQSGKNTVELMLTVTGTMALWSGILAIAEKSGLTDAAARALRPLLRLIMPGLKKGGDAEKFVCVNVVANILGLGNAATPPGIRAMKAMRSESQLPDGSPSREMVTFAVINTASIQLIPTTVMSLRGAAGSEDPAGILLSVWMTSLSALMAGLLMCAVFAGHSRQPSLR